jgi:hypothetical protein
MKYAIEMDSGAVMYINICLGIQKLRGEGGFTVTQTALALA